VKLSAPPPPPPDPNDPSQQPGANDPGPAVGEAAAPPPAETTGPAPRKVLAWPAWFGGADFLLAVLAVGLAFLVASFVARNTDVWLHLAAGKRLLAGEYTPGTDPFSYSAADRTWVNHSLLFDAAAYLLYRNDGALLVVVKALAVAAAFGLLIGIRRPGYALWPWAATAAVAVVAAATYLLLRPIIGSVFLLAVTLYLLFRMPHRAGSWRFPIAVGVTFWVWAMVDEWFFLGPLALALVLIGELIQQQFRKPDAGASEGTPDPLGPLPDVPTLARALAVGVVACMLTPHLWRVWGLPFELAAAPEASADDRFRQNLMGPLSENFFSDKPLGRARGYNQNGLAYALLLVGGGAALALAGSRVRLAHLALWLGFATLSLVTMYAIPFLAVVAVPLIAGQFNALSAGLALKTWGDPKTRLLLLGSAGGRVLSLIAVAAACVLAWPGWIHPHTDNAAYARRVAWAVEPDPGLKRGAEQLQQWRESGQLPADARGLIASVDLANYCAWFAPLEKVYFNGRLNHHRAELPNYLTVRAGLELIRVNEDERPKPRPQEVAEVFRTLGAEYVVIHTGPGESAQSRHRARAAAEQQWLDPDHWSPWYLDGRSTVCGWRARPGAEKPTFAALRLDPVVLAFGPGVERLKPVTVRPVPPTAGWEEAFVRAPGVAPAGADETSGWQDYKRVRLEELDRKQLALLRAFQITDAIVGGAGLLAPAVPQLQADDSTRAVAFLALRAARRAVAADPDHPDGYLALAQALGDPHLPIPEDERMLGQITALRQCLVRLPPPQRFRPGIYTASPTQVAWGLAQLYLNRRREFGLSPPGISLNMPAFQLLAAPRDSGFLRAAAMFYVFEGGRARRVWVGEADLPGFPGQPLGGGPFLLPLDLAREYLILADKYLDVELPDDPDVRANPQVKALRDEVKRDLRFVEGEVVQATNRYESGKMALASGPPKLLAQVELALRYNLVGEALRLLTDKDTDPARDFPQNLLQVALSRVALQLAVGRLEDAATDLDALAGSADVQRALAGHLQPPYRMLLYVKHLLEGNYAEAGDAIEGLEERLVPPDPFEKERAQFPKAFYVALGGKLRTWVEYSPLSALLAPTPFDLAARTEAPLVAVAGYPPGRRPRSPGFGTLRDDFQARREQAADFYTRRGFLSLYEGDIAGAKRRFLMTRQPAVKDWDLPEYRNATAELYLRMIEEAEKRSAEK
jgi:hypothetical protein